MGKAGRPPGPLRGRTEQANALAQFLRELTAESTVSDLEKRYSLARSSWSEYRSGQKIIPWDRLSKVVEHRFAHDPRARQLAMDNARRLHAAATSAQPLLAPRPSAPIPAVPAPTERPAATEAGCAGQAADNPPTSTDTTSNFDVASDPERPGEPTAALPDAVPPRPEDAGAPEPAEPQMRPPTPPSFSTDPVATASLPTDGPPAPASLPTDGPPAPAPATARKRTGGERTAGAGSWWTRWRTPVQWALLAALLAAVIIANQAQRPGGQPAAEPSAPSTADSGGTQPANVPPDSAAPSGTPEQPPTSPAPEPPAASTPATLPPDPAGTPAAPSTSSSRPAAAPTRPAATSPQPAATPPPPAPVPAAPDGPPRRSLRNLATGLCIDVPTSGVPNMGHPVVQERCGAGGEHLQSFDLVPAAGGANQFALRPAGSALCVDPPEHGAPAPSQVGLYPCDLTAADNHLWRLQWNDTNAFLLVNVKSDGTATPMCLDVPGHADPTPGLRLGVYPCHPDPGDDQWWAFA
ncbi:hypothetical protein ACIRD3_12710 [Kitasatospora sp. NPDC093550]|uniref:RICIN domain-containing protein n=1 Tax=Kitasatospora sp. NPDC093550 TaxID=3364089 RepID=UPI003803C2BB